MATAVEARGSGRRLRLALRVGGAAVVVGGLVFAGLRVHPAAVATTGPDPTDWRGKTAQGLAVAATINGKWLDGLGVHLELRCDGGARAESLTWAPAPDLYVQNGDTVTATQAPRSSRGTDGWTLRTEGRLAMVVGDRPHGTASVTVRWSRRDARVLCQSGPIAFSLARRAT
ncbi:hypothetical protein DSM104299_01884 [Baekduia alba]|uniref:hypothetical protein n=1 Tax=Baekduia alba TaxID=2997333 RepID=UPI002340E409|nr:hypothetical protein [Baekduia alba]WCB93178.1 hypothetical protein DSM104299_01884 [Baekduia alba]